MYSIGEFSRMCALSIKTLRFYHEKGLLIPARVERETGYRYYDERNLEVARVIASLRTLEFSLDEIAAMLAAYEDDGDVLMFLERQRSKIAAEIRRRRDVVHLLEGIIEDERNARRVMSEVNYEIEEKTVEPVLIGGLRMKGRYADCSKGFSKLGRAFGRHIAGKAMMLCYDREYREEDADFEVCMPIKRAVEGTEADVRELPGGRFLTLVHPGPYDELTRSYSRLFEYASENGLELGAPSREVYLKGPGMIFKGNPKKYLTEIQFPIAR